MQNGAPRLLIVHGDRFMRESICMGLRDFETSQASDAVQALEAFTASIPDAVLVWNRLAGAMDGAALCAKIRMLPGGAVPVYVMGEEDDDALVRSVFEAGAMDYLLWPVHLGLLSRRIRRDLEAAAVGRSNGRQMDRTHAESELFRTMPIPALLVGAQGTVAMANEAFERVFSSRNSVLGRAIEDLVGSTFDAQDRKAMFTELCCQSRGRVAVRVLFSKIGNGPWKGCEALFFDECQHSEPEANRRGVEAQASHVLVLEDYEVVSHSIRRLLEKAGHRVSIAAEASLAVRLFSEAIEAGDRFNLAILDLSLPGSAGGTDVLNALRRMDPDLPAIVTSGAWTDPAMSKPSLFGFDAALKKPFSRNELTDVVNKVLTKRHVRA
jgi:DNA-binding response OmpR family regulator